MNLTIRQSSAYLSRRTLSHARSTDTLDAHLELLRCYYNFVRPHGALKFGRETRTPAMQAGLATRRLTLRDIFVSVRHVILWLSDARVFADSRRTAAVVMYMLHYEVVEKIGEGGMGEVFKAVDLKLDRDQVFLTAVHPASEGQHEKLQRRGHHLRVPAGGWDCFRPRRIFRTLRAHGRAAIHEPSSSHALRS